MIPVQLIFRNGVSSLFGSAQNLYFDDREIAECMCIPFFLFARHGRALTGASPEHAQIVGSV